MELPRNAVIERAFWIAAALAVVGGVGPLLVAVGHTNRIGAVLFPFAAAALAMVALALFYRQGRAIAALVYFAGGLAIAYGMLLILAVPLRLAVEGECPPAPQRCAAGLELQLSGPEGTGLTIAVIFGVMALLAGFVGLAMVYRQRAAPPPAPVWPAQPPAKSEPPPPPPSVAASETIAAEPEPAPEPEPPPFLELAAPEPEPPVLELRAPAEPAQAAESAPNLPPPAKPRTTRKRKPKPPSE